MVSRIVWFLEISAFVKLSLVIVIFFICVILMFMDWLFNKNIFAVGAGLCYFLKIPFFYLFLISLMVIRWNEVPKDHLFIKMVGSILVILISELLSFVVPGSGLGDGMAESFDDDVKDNRIEEKGIENNLESSEKTLAHEAECPVDTMSLLLRPESKEENG